MIEPGSVRIVLLRGRNPLNLGAAARAMANFGLHDLVLVAPYGEAWRQARSARAGAAVLASARVAATLAEAVADCDFVVGTTDGAGRATEVPLEDWRTVASSLPGRRAALIFGSEKTGLEVDDISHCHRLARLPTVPGAPSMNLGQAVAVCAYELARRGSLAAPAPATAVTVAERERLLETWYPLLERVGVVRPGHRASQTRLLRQMLLRWRLLPADVTRLLGVARQVRHAMARGLHPGGDEG
ncbi:MAG: RNA methyltransferase [Terriglobales bacterium]